MTYVLFVFTALLRVIVASTTCKFQLYETKSSLRGSTTSKCSVFVHMSHIFLILLENSDNMTGLNV